MKHVEWLGACLLVAGVASWNWMRLDGQTLRAGPAARPFAAPAVHQPTARAAAWPPAMPFAVTDTARVPLLPVDPPESAAQSLAQARIHGDSRTPPISRSDSPGQSASEEELADPAAYANYEQRQNLRMLQAFDQAAASKVPALQADVARARVLGIPAEDIDKMEQKIEMLQAARRQLQHDHPELGPASGQP